MPIFKNCICVAQARVIAGRKRDSHICTIAYQPDQSKFLRLCIPYVPGKSPALKRWYRFDFEGSKDTLPNIDTREESWDVVSLVKDSILKKESEKRQVHRALLSQYKYEGELNANRQSIGILIPVPKTLEFSLKRFNPHNPSDQKKLGHQQLMASKGIWFPPFEVQVKGSYRKNGELKSFNKQLLAWDVYEALRNTEKKVDPFEAIYRYRNPYMIIGNLPKQRNAFMVIGILSAPDGAIQECAINQQLIFC